MQFMFPGEEACEHKAGGHFLGGRGGKVIFVLGLSLGSKITNSIINESHLKNNKNFDKMEPCHMC